MKKLFIFIAALAAANGAYAAAPGSCKASAADELSRGFTSAQQRGFAESFPVVPQPGLPEPVNPQFKAPVQPACQKPPVLIFKGGKIYNGNTLLGVGATDFKTGCTNNVAWKDKAGYVYRNADRLGHGVKEYEITALTGDVVWTDGYKFLHRNQDRIGSALQKHTLAAVTGDVIFTDTWDYLYKNSGRNTARIGSDVRSYKTSAFTGTVAWTDSHNYLYKTTGVNTVRLGSSVKEYSIASFTGDVAWKDSGALYKNGARLSREAQEYRMNAYGIVTWKDRDGDLHTA